MAARRRRHGRSDAEVDDLDLPLLVHHHVSRRDVAVDDVHPPMRVVEGATDLDADVGALVGVRPGPLFALPSPVGCVREGAQRCWRPRRIPSRESTSPSSTPSSYTGTMFGCERFTVVFASRTKRRTKSSSQSKLVAYLLHDESLLEAARAVASPQDDAGLPAARELALKHVLAEHLGVHQLRSMGSVSVAPRGGRFGRLGARRA